MSKEISHEYKGWTIKLIPGGDLCASFSFTLINPQGGAKHVGTGGATEERALERAQEMIDAEEALAK